MNNPLKYVDPSGHTPVLALWAITWMNAVLSSPDLQQDFQQLSLDASQGNMAGVGIDFAAAAIPGVSATMMKGAGKVLSEGERIIGQSIRPTSNRVFWSGGNAAERAAVAAAKESGAVTLGMTKAGIRVDKATEGLDYLTEGRAKWAAASERFARGAKGEVNVYRTEQISKDSIWNKVELPTLKSNPKVTKIIEHYVK